MEDPDLLEKEPGRGLGQGESKEGALQERLDASQQIKKHRRRRKREKRRRRTEENRGRCTNVARGLSSYAMWPSVKKQRKPK
jgi:hypothetical protein